MSCVQSGPCGECELRSIWPRVGVLAAPGLCPSRILIPDDVGIQQDRRQNWLPGTNSNFMGSCEIDCEQDPDVLDRGDRLETARMMLLLIAFSVVASGLC